MKRSIDAYLQAWSQEPQRKPLLLRGARQVGKTFAARQLGKKFTNCVEINFEFAAPARQIFQYDLDPARIIVELAALVNKPIEPGKTLLFFDEIQFCPQAFASLRYFYEMLPNLHVIAAGSLLDFLIQEIGMPVGRVTSAYMHPMSFLEFLQALQEDFFVQLVRSQQPSVPLSEALHHKGMKLLGQYFAIGGMPEAVMNWVTNQNFLQVQKVHHALLDSYKQDFAKYAKNHQIQYVSTLFEKLPNFICDRFKYSAIPGEFRKRELAPCLDLLVTAGVIHKVIYTSGQGVPLGALANLDDFKILFLDVALAQAALGLELGGWLSDPLGQIVNKGALAEMFVGLEFLAYSQFFKKEQLFYWHRDARSSQAEIDFITVHGGKLIPVEVKSGSGSTLRSLHAFLQTYPNVDTAWRFSAQNYSITEKIQSWPLYAVFAAVLNV